MWSVQNSNKILGIFKTQIVLTQHHHLYLVEGEFRYTQRNILQICIHQLQDILENEVVESSIDPTPGKRISSDTLRNDSQNKQTTKRLQLMEHGATTIKLHCRNDGGFLSNVQKAQIWSNQKTFSIFDGLQNAFLQTGGSPHIHKVQICGVSTVWLSSQQLLQCAVDLSSSFSYLLDIGCFSISLFISFHWFGGRPHLDKVVDF